MINMAAVSIPKYFMLLDVDVSDVVVEDVNFEFDNPENKPPDDELVLEFVSPKEKNIVM